MRKEDKIKAEQTIMPLIQYYFNNNKYWGYNSLAFGDFLEVAYERNYRIPFLITKKTNYQYRIYFIKKLIKKYIKNVDTEPIK